MTTELSPDARKVLSGMRRLTERYAVTTAGTTVRVAHRKLQIAVGHRHLPRGLVDLIQIGYLAASGRGRNRGFRLTPAGIAAAAAHQTN